MSRTDIEVFWIVASTDSCDCSWIAELDYHVREESGSIRIDRDGVPFRTTATDRADWYCPWTETGNSLENLKPRIMERYCRG